MNRVEAYSYHKITNVHARIQFAGGLRRMRERRQEYAGEIPAHIRARYEEVRPMAIDRFLMPLQINDSRS